LSHSPVHPTHKLHYLTTQFLQAGCPSCRIKALKAQIALHAKCLAKNMNCITSVNANMVFRLQPANTETILQLYRLLLDIHTYTHPFNGPLSGITWVSRYQKGNTNLDFTEARVSKWQWHQLGHMQVCTSLQTDNHASTPPQFFTGRMPFQPPNQQRQSTEGNRLLLD